MAPNSTPSPKAANSTRVASAARSASVIDEQQRKEAAISP
jgi:hypothetical protein